jgi:enterochelin esterase family protein
MLPAADDDRLTLTAKGLRAALAAELSREAASELAGRLRDRFGAEDLRAGKAALVDESVVGWAIEAEAERPPAVVAEAGPVYRQRLRRLGETNVYAATASFPDGTAMRWAYEVDGAIRGGGQLELFRPHPDSRERPGAPKGRLLPQPRWRSEVFAGTTRDWSIYLPAQYDAARPACVMVFQDGVRMYQAHVPTVLDNLIAAGDMPVTIGLFLDPGVYADTTASNRSFEYDTLSDQYARFLLEEILPAVGADYALRQDAAGRAICGMSSGGICAFTAAWQRPDQFGKVLSHVGSFTNIAAGITGRDGGHNYPSLIRRVWRKPIRVYLQAGQNDLNRDFGNWWLANLEMADALRFAGYDCKLVTGGGFHSLAHGLAILPDSLRWLWRGA